jgi:aspartyl-tRNA(Asn)/glutamyl-tRNA(Gln) amidotransferase subunit C
MEVDKKTIEHIANLANLDLSEEEKSELPGQLSKILSYVEKVNTIDLENVVPTSQVIDLENVLREDKVKESLKTDEVLTLAPDKEKGHIKVPKFL